MANAGPRSCRPATTSTPSLITDPLLASFAELLASSEIFRFDGADMMPGAVGSGTFWTEATAWIVGGDTEDHARQHRSELARRLITTEMRARARGCGSGPFAHVG